RRARLSQSKERSPTMSGRKRQTRRRQTAAPPPGMPPWVAANEHTKDLVRFWPELMNCPALARAFSVARVDVALVSAEWAAAELRRLARRLSTEAGAWAAFAGPSASDIDQLLERLLAVL